MNPEMENSPGILALRRLEVQMISLRDKNRGEDSDEEDVILEDMDDVWWKTMSQEERDYAQSLRGNSPNHEALVRWL